jgi:hypothetical protein
VCNPASSPFSVGERDIVRENERGDHSTRTPHNLPSFKLGQDKTTHTHTHTHTHKHTHFRAPFFAQLSTQPHNHTQRDASFTPRRASLAPFCYKAPRIATAAEVLPVLERARPTTPFLAPPFCLFFSSASHPVRRLANPSSLPLSAVGQENDPARGLLVIVLGGS